MGAGRLSKRSLTLQGHRTSVALELPFWQALERCAADRGEPVAALIARVDAGRSGGLASALRVFVLAEAEAGRLPAKTALEAGPK